MMKRYVADTQCVLWYFAEEDHRMPRAARSAFEGVQDGPAQILVPSIALVEAIFFAERHRATARACWPN